MPINKKKSFASPILTLFTLSLLTLKMEMMVFQESFILSSSLTTGLEFVGSCNGLVLVEDNENSQFLINPTTLKYHQIPNFHLALPFDDSFCISGLGYDFTSDDYKVVTLSQYFADYEMNIDITFVDVYSVRKGRWRRLEILPYTPFLASGVFVDGALHWLVWNNSRDSFLIVAFDLSNETFLEVPTPSTMDNTVMCYYLTAFRGCLCMCTNAGEDKTAVWMMKEYGVKESWTKFSVRGPTTVFDFVPLCLMSDDDVVLDVYNEKLTVYNMKEDQWRDMIVDGITAKSLQAETQRVLSLLCLARELRDTLLLDALLLR